MAQNSQQIFDYSLLKQRHKRALTLFSSADFIHEAAAKSLVERLQDVKRDFDRALIVGGRYGAALKAQLVATGKVKEVVIADISEGWPEQDRVITNETLPCDAEEFDLVVFFMSLSNVNDIPGLLVQGRMALVSDGMMSLVMAGNGTLDPLKNAVLQSESELKGSAERRFHPLPDARDVASLMQWAGLALPISDEEVIAVSYASVMDVFKDLKAIGSRRFLSEKPESALNKGLINQAELFLKQGNDRFDLPVHLVYGIGWAPGHSQQKPLPPGSGQISLTDIL